MTLEKLRIIPEDFKTEELLAKEVLKSMREFYLEILSRDELVTNSGDILETALIRGDVYFDNGIFKGKFNASLSKKLKNIGAVWTGKGFKIDPQKLSTQYLSAIAQGRFKNDRDIQNLLNNLMGVNLEKVASKANIDKIYQKAITNLNKDLNESLGKIPIVQAQFDENQTEQIKAKYSDNMRLHIRGWGDDKIKSLRAKVEDNVKSGKRYSEIVDVIVRDYNTSPKRAQFIARQETMLLTTEMKLQKYEKAGVKKFIWHARHDSKVRDLHKHLDGKVFSFDDPPIIDERTGQRGFPGQSFGCRCNLQGVRE